MPLYRPGPVVSFIVGARVGSWNGGGYLSVAPTVLVLEPGRLTSHLTAVTRIVHSEPEVMVLKARAAPLWMSLSVVVEGVDQDGQERVGLAIFGAFGRRRLIETLESSGFVVTQRATWLYQGGDLIRPWP
jgi:hypothetical protein